MTVQVQNFAKRNFGQSSIHPMPHFPFSTTTWWNSQEQQFPQPLSNSLSLKVGSPPQAFPEEKNAGHQSQGQDSSSTQSTDESHPTVAAIAGKNSQDPCNSSDSAQDGSYKHVEGQVKPVMFLPNPGFGVNPPQFETINTSMAHIPYAYGDPFVNGLYTAYGPQSIEFGQIHPQMIGMAPARVPLPIELAEDGPIYVNAKQYNGILRRRQVRAKLEAQNKLLKNRKPYLHESRHLHALNRVRGSGGRFLSSKKQPPRNPTPANSDLGSRSVNQTETGKRNVTNNDAVFQQTHHVFSNISSHTGGNRGIMFNGSYGNEHSFPVVR